MTPDGRKVPFSADDDKYGRYRCDKNVLLSANGRWSPVLYQKSVHPSIRIGRNQVFFCSSSGGCINDRYGTEQKPDHLCAGITHEQKAGLALKKLSDREPPSRCCSKAPDHAVRHPWLQ